MPATPLSVFLSSTCHDLADLRSELAEYLKLNGFMVRMSEAPASGFCVEPEADSIQSCLANVESADVVLCIIDRRYGPPIPKYENRSATHVEVLHARKFSRPVFYFIREATLAAYGSIGTGVKLPWIQETGGNAARLKQFIEEVRAFDEHSNKSNWYDSFKTVVDLKPVALKRLVDRFKEKAASLALQPDRYVRLTFAISATNPPNSATIHGDFRNIGIGPAVNIVHGWTNVSCTEGMEKYFWGGLAEGEQIKGGFFGYSGLPKAERVITIFCEYENRFRDKYRVEQQFERNANDIPILFGREKLFVAPPGIVPGLADWIEV